MAQQWSSAQEVADKVREIILAELREVSPSKVTREASFEGDLGADSLDTVELVLAFELAFDIEIPDSDQMKIRTVGDAGDYVCEQLRKKGALK